MFPHPLRAVRAVIATVALLAATVAPLAAHADLVSSGELIKGSGPAVYYYGGGKRYVFMDERIFFSWYQNFEDVHVISDAGLASLPLGGNVTYRPGTLVKLATDPKVYVVELPSTLRWVTTEQVARDEFGDDWNTKIENLSDTQFTDYDPGEPVTGPLNFLTSGFWVYSYESVLYNPLDAPQDPETLQAYPHPPSADVFTGVFPYMNGGYLASSTQSVSEVRDWFMQHASGWSLTFSYANAVPESGDELALLDFTQPRGTREAHRSLFINTMPGEPELSYFQFLEVEYPEGYPIPPSSISATFVDEDGDVGSLMLSTTPRTDLIDWYRQTLLAQGWTEPVLQNEPPRDLNSDPLVYRTEHRGHQTVLRYAIGISSLLNTLSVVKSNPDLTTVLQEWTPGVE